MCDFVHLCIFFFKQKTAYEMRISDWSSDVGSSDLLAEKKSLALREGDRIRWTANDKARGLFNSALARVATVESGAIVVEMADRQQLRLAAGDPMLPRLDLAYSLTLHMAQGTPTDKAIPVLSTHVRHLSKLGRGSCRDTGRQ